MSGTLSVNVTYRPIRIGFCIRQDNIDDYKKALKLTHTLWGGRYNPIIPVGNDGVLVPGYSFIDSLKLQI